MLGEANFISKVVAITSLAMTTKPCGSSCCLIVRYFPSTSPSHDKRSFNMTFFSTISYIQRSISRGYTTRKMIYDDILLLPERYHKNYVFLLLPFEAAEEKKSEVTSNEIKTKCSCFLPAFWQRRGVLSLSISHHRNDKERHIAVKNDVA
jgi:hypothetical protein